jgi:O-acetyl-ADP-ribose deacetylase (regulator of RNase III)
MRKIEGDLIRLALEGHFDVIVHVANCQCTMCAGIAKQIRQTFPEAYEADLATEKGSRDKLGTISVATVERNGRQLVVVTAYTQLHFRGSGVCVDCEAIRAAMRVVKRFFGKRIGYPRIGAGLGRGDWSIISEILDEELADEDHTLVEYKP